MRNEKWGMGIEKWEMRELAARRAQLKLPAYGLVVADPA